ncbi:MAG TPA: LrgB family protein [Bacillota bacterium]|nr:LrgB family protein [Bacillota bacterium]
MNEFILAPTIIVLTIILYLAINVLYQKFRTLFLLPVFITSVTIVTIILVGNISYDTYMIGGVWIDRLLGPAVVALAYPLYQQRETLKKLKGPILTGVLFGSVFGVVSGVLFVKILGFEDYIAMAVSPKSVTTPVAMAISESLGGSTTLTAVFVMFAGTGGPIISPYVMKLFRLDGDMGRGVGLGTASHGIGTSVAMEESQLQGSISTIAMIVSAVVVSLITPLILAVLL